ncbi:hypothetical protein AWH56_006095 [Anaerobacillus isosaccharinicus]|uniref:D-glucuronyl C5-epimerase C-terminal domain-containing protein n=1 Tax=Anaerobacillus isosaccharinicus TaxID=1532552 RepID=A0A1S2M6F7_9BACI|nr:hypothetical protein [Anaerobacillus isosaccharinicus]MBA5584406.1 hypothetical protein [Anaerobacillus isosaccharinicus]QOY37202.1 hypothetical protein AWH56_006095 [Anaerobacillus isosaccharinicus]
MSLKPYLFLFVCLILTVGCESSTLEKTNHFSLPLNHEMTVEISSEEIEFGTAKVTEDFHTISEDKSYHYELLKKKDVVGQLTITIRTLDNQDQMIFSRLDNFVDEHLIISVSLPVGNVNRYELVDFDQIFIEREHDSTLGIDPTTYPIGLFDLYFYEDFRYSFFASKNYISKQLSLDYENGGFSTLRDLVEENKQFSTKVNDQQLLLELPLHSYGSDISESWFMISSERLFEEKEHLNEWVEHSNRNYAHINKWLTPDGNYKKLPWSIEPFTKLGYGRNIGSMQDKLALDNYEATSERFFYNLTMNSVVMLEAYQKENEDVWMTEYTSTWLKNSYETIAPFVDTRHNENVALFLTRVGNRFNIDELKDSHLNYANYLLEQVEVGNTFPIGQETFFIADYYSPHPGTMMTHASLNHILGGINFLLDSYFYTSNNDYLELAMIMRSGIEELGENWIRDNGDLWYQINPDLTFTGNDYEQLTLYDLLLSQQKWEAVGLDRSKLFDTLITSKMRYLYSQNKTLIPLIEEMLADQE